MGTRRKYNKSRASQRFWGQNEQKATFLNRNDLIGYAKFTPTSIDEEDPIQIWKIFLNIFF